LSKIDEESLISDVLPLKIKTKSPIIPEIPRVTNYEESNPSFTKNVKLNVIPLINLNKSDKSIASLQTNLKPLQNLQTKLNMRQLEPNNFSTTFKFRFLC